MVSLTSISLAGPLRASALHDKGPQISMVGVEGRKGEGKEGEASGREREGGRE